MHNAQNPQPPMPLCELRSLTRTAMFAALIAVGSFIIVPIGPTHFTLQTMMIILSGFCLGPKRALYVVFLYLAAGLVGLPVFGRGKSGLAAFLSPACGYMAGFVVGAATAGMAVWFRGKKQRWRAMLFFGFVGAMLILVFGAVGMRFTVARDWSSAFAFGALPFVLTDTLKVAAAAALCQSFFASPSTIKANDEK